MIDEGSPCNESQGVNTQKNEERRARRRNPLAPTSSLKKAARNEHEGKQSVDIDFETGAHLRRNAEHTAEGHGEGNL